MFPRIVYVNKMDMHGRRFLQCPQNDATTVSSATAVPHSACPSARRTPSAASCDLIRMKAYVFYDELGKDMREEEIPEELAELAAAVPGS